MQAYVNNIQIVSDPLTGDTSTVNLNVISKVIISGNNQADIILSEILDADTGLDLSNQFSYYKELIVTETPEYTTAKNAFVAEFKNLYRDFLQSKGVNLANVTID